MKAKEWIDAAKKKSGISSDYAIAKRLGMTQSAVSNIRNSESTLSDEYAVEVARVLGIDPLHVIIDQHRERTTNECAREAWERLGKRIDFANGALVF